jgi:hypothetical protein
MTMGGGGALNLEAIHSDLDETMTLRLQAGQELQTGRGKSLQASWQTIVPDIDDTPATAVLPTCTITEVLAQHEHRSNPLICSVGESY